MTLSTTIRYMTGAPFTIFDSSIDADRNGELDDPLPAGTYSGTAVNAMQDVEFDGKRNGAGGPDIFQVDVRAGWRRVRGRGLLEVFLDIFNITNRTNFENPVLANRDGPTSSTWGPPKYKPPPPLHPCTFAPRAPSPSLVATDCPGGRDRDNDEHPGREHREAWNGSAKRAGRMAHCRPRVRIEDPGGGEVERPPHRRHELQPHRSEVGSEATAIAIASPSRERDDQPLEALGRAGSSAGRTSHWVFAMAE